MSQNDIGVLGRAVEALCMRRLHGNMAVTVWIHDIATCQMMCTFVSSRAVSEVNRMYRIRSASKQAGGHLLP